MKKMKISRHKKVHRILQFYSNNYGFRKPYQVLIDGTLCHAALKNKVHIENQFKKYLEGDVKLLTTECNVIEVDKLGPAFSGASFIIKQYPIHRCGHSKAPVSGSTCILDMVSDGNPSRYIVATQDRELQTKCRGMEGVPIIYLHMKTPTLEAPSDFSKEAANNRVHYQFQISEYEKRRLELLDDSSNNLIGIRRKRKKKGGPNPLSCKKKKKVPNSEENIPNKKKDKKTKTRKRNRSRLAQKIKKELVSSSNF